LGVEVYITPGIDLLDSLWVTSVLYKFEAILLIACMSAQNIPHYDSRTYCTFCSPLHYPIYLAVGLELHYDSPHFHNQQTLLFEWE
jgi:hypothetical protein